jgi:hypothetical protein
MGQLVVCDVSAELASRFDIVLKDGRILSGCGVQGSGGPLRGDDAVQRARRLLFKPNARDREVEEVLVYITERADRTELVSIPRSSFVSLDVHDEASQ